VKLLLCRSLPLWGTEDRNCALVLGFIAFGLAILVSSGIATAQKSIRQVDFKNFTYPLSGTLLGHDRLQWLSVPSAAHPGGRHIHLVNGSDLTKASNSMGLEYAQFEGFTFQSVQFADLTGDGSEEAIVVLLYHTGGTQNTNYVYIYSFEGGKPKLLAYCYTGDRAYHGLYKVYGDRGTLAFELFDPRKRSGDCCSSGLVRMQYRWHEDRFEAFGPREFRTLKKP
jgi:hypothetical protein